MCVGVFVCGVGGVGRGTCGVRVCSVHGEGGDVCSVCAVCWGGWLACVWEQSRGQARPALSPTVRKLLLHGRPSVSAAQASGPL
jgi:hypothetical protein